MFNFFKRKKDTEDKQETGAEGVTDNTEQGAEEAAGEIPASAEQPSEAQADTAEAPQQAAASGAEGVEEAAEQPADTAETVSRVDESEAEAQPELPAEGLTAADSGQQAEQQADTAVAAEQAQPQAKKGGFFSRIRQGLSKTRGGLTDGLANLLLGKKEIDDDLLEDLETQLIMADVGVDTTQAIMQRLTDRVSRKELGDSDALYDALISELQDTLRSVQAPLTIDGSKTPYVILMVGINGVGKTTTIGKLAKQFQNDGKSVMLAAGDTFRAAAVEQLQVWGERNNVPVIAQHTGADSASVIFDAVQAAKSRQADILIADTAGRLHNKDNLMQELEKVVRVMKKLDDTAPHEVMLVLDAGTGQNAVNQAKQFQQAVGVTGLTLTKLDGTAKGGIIFSLAQQFGLPVRYIGVGEGIDDLRTFNAEEFTKALFQREADEQ
ncbi:MAG: signal recognition particle-docking protein FtsY [Oceanospirillaceae bacterium]|mgnify:CR=1 FL=1|nr:signal recognition particle-docking protein FtsY [Oceanospirillaceae bacterium]MBT14105.1 signal recognition particle-docking protein FtsY [Oceanospirillaceae bacterium]|tara:strand:- start:30144 stop:31457 length:1314 start_codon:yes stop_codon:yes gene_type:complete